MEELNHKIKELTGSLLILKNKLDYLEGAILDDNELVAKERLDDKVKESEVLKKQLGSLAREVYGQENIPDSLGNRISTCYDMQRDIIMRIDRVRTLMEQMDDDNDSIFDKDSFIKGMFPNQEDYQDYLDGDY